VDGLTRTLSGLVAEAFGNLQPASVGCGIGRADGISFNRRPVNVEGKTVMSLVLEPGQATVAASAGHALRRAWQRGGDKGPRLSPPLEGLGGLRAGPSDPEIPLLKITSPDGQPLGGLVNFGCHPVVGGDDNFYAISPDYPYEARQAFEATVGAPLAFCLGCAGDQVPAWRGGDSRVRVGRSLGAAAARAWYQIRECNSDVPVATAKRDIVLDVVDLPSVAEAEAALAAVDDPQGTGGMMQRHILNLARKFEGKPGIETEIIACRIGDFAAVGLPGETLMEIGLQIKQQSPFETTAVVTLCNDCIGYISTAQAHREGGYEPEWSAPGPGAERQIVDAALDLLRELR